MKKNLFALLLTLTFAHFGYAQELKATSIQDLMEEMDTVDFEYKERGMIFGFASIQSCLYVSEEFAIIKNYCFPDRKYPARGLTIISKKFGMIDLYEEQLQGVLKRDIQISEFPQVIGPYLSTPFPHMTINGVSDMIEKLYHQHNPACWSTNYSAYTQAPEANCYPRTDNVLNFELWSKETQAITADLDTWYAMMEIIEAKINM